MTSNLFDLSSTCIVRTIEKFKYMLMSLTENGSPSLFLLLFLFNLQLTFVPAQILKRIS